MTPSDIERAARAAVLDAVKYKDDLEQFTERMAQAIRAERERCVKIVEEASITVFMHWDADHAHPVQRPVEHRDLIAKRLWGPETAE